MRILLVNGWSDDNKGDAAIVQGLAQLISRVASARGLKPTVGILSSFCASDPLFEYHYRFTAPSDGVMELYGALLPTVVSAKKRGRRWAVRAWLLLRSLVILCLAPLFEGALVKLLMSRSERRTFDGILSADVVIAKGGHIYFSNGTFGSLVGLYMNLFPLLLAQRLRKRCAISAQSIGPVHGKLQKALLSRALTGCAKVQTREKLSEHLIADLVGANVPSLTWDTAFVISEEPLRQSIVDQLPTEFVAMTVRQWHFPFDQQRADEKYRQYLHVVAEVIRRINNVYSLPVVLVPQVIGPTESENDYVAWEQLREYIGNSIYYELREDLRPGELKALYSRARIVIGTRFHSVILALSAGTPSLAIGYHGYKAQGIMQMCGLDEYVLDIDQLSIDDVWQRFCDLHERRLALQEQLQELMVRVNKDCVNAVETILFS